MRILGIDYGERRIGIAVSDPLGLVAGGLETVQNRGNIEETAKAIKAIVDEYDIKKIVVGMPKNMNNTEGFRAEATYQFIAAVSKEIDGVEVITWDERLTTVIAGKTMNDMGVKRKDKKKNVDRIAAVLILQAYLDRSDSANS